MFNLRLSGPPHRYNPYSLLPAREDGRPVNATDPADRQKPRLVFRSRWRFQKPFVLPEGLRLLKIDPVLGPIGLALGGIKFELHGLLWYKLYTFSIPNPQSRADATDTGPWLELLVAMLMCRGMGKQEINEAVLCAFKAAWPKAEVDYSSPRKAVAEFAESGCADKNYLDELGKAACDKGAFVSRIWEALLYQRFKSDGWVVSGGGEGPDFRLEKGSLKILVQAVAPQPGDPCRSGMSLAWQNRKSGERFTNVYDEMLTRLTGALKQKKNDHLKHIEKSCADAGVPFVIAVNDIRLRSGHGHYPITGLPLILHAVLPVGTPAMIENVETGEVIDGPRLQWRLEIPRRNGLSVPTDVFCSKDYDCVSAVIYCWSVDSPKWSIRSICDPNLRHPPCVVAHNPRAKNPLPLGWLPGAIEYVIELERGKGCVGATDVEAFTIKRLTPPSTPPRTS